MTGFGSGRRARVLFAALLLALIVPLVPASSQSVAAQDATGGPSLALSFTIPPLARRRAPMGWSCIKRPVTMASPRSDRWS